MKKSIAFLFSLAVLMTTLALSPSEAKTVGDEIKVTVCDYFEFDVAPVAIHSSVCPSLDVHSSTSLEFNSPEEWKFYEVKPENIPIGNREIKHNQTFGIHSDAGNDMLLTCSCHQCSPDISFGNWNNEWLSNSYHPSMDKFIIFEFVGYGGAPARVYS